MLHSFAYMIAPDAQINVPRRKTPRTRIPAGSVALAGEFSGIYPQASPGGWQLIGKTDMTMWDIDRAEPALLKPGYQVSFYNADQAPQLLVCPRLIQLKIAVCYLQLQPRKIPR